MSTGAERIVRGACPHDCPDTCAWAVTVDSLGRATRLMGDKGHPFTRGGLCAKVNAYLANRVYNPDRVLHPLRRVGVKGAGEFERLGWDEALADISARWREIIAQSGAEAILPWRDRGGGLAAMTGRRMRTPLPMHRLGMPELEDAAFRSVNLLEIGRALTSHDLSPPIRSLFVCSANPAVIAPNQNRVLEGLAREDLFVVVRCRACGPSPQWAHRLNSGHPCRPNDDATDDPATREVVNRWRADPRQLARDRRNRRHEAGGGGRRGRPRCAAPALRAPRPVADAEAVTAMRRP